VGEIFGFKKFSKRYLLDDIIKYYLTHTPWKNSKNINGSINGVSKQKKKNA